MTEAFAAATPRAYRRRRKRGRQLKPPRMKRLEDRYAARIFGVVDAVTEAVSLELDPLLAGIVAEQAQDERTHPGVKLDDAGDRIARIFQRVTVFAEQTISLPRLQRQAETTGREINDVNDQHNVENVQAVLGVQLFPTEPWLETEMDHFVHENASLIKGLAEEQVRDIEQSVYRAVRAGASTKEIQRDILAIVGVTKSRAKLISRDQVNKFNGRLSQLRQQSLGITTYTWRTSDDERVRPSHQRLDDTVQTWDAPPVTVFTGKRAGETNHPGGDIQCRCIAEPLFPDEL